MSASIGFEKELWNIACTLRGNMDASEYKQVILGLIFLKYISDRFESRYNELVEEREGFEEDEDEYTAVNIFFVPEKARWRYILENAKSEEIGVIIDNAMRVIETRNKKLKNVLPKNFARVELDKKKLGSVIEQFHNIKIESEDKDILGRTYEYCLSQFAEQEGKKGGEFYTPTCIVETIVEILKPYKGRVYDPCCGSGGMFVQSKKFIDKHKRNINNISVYGQESNSTTWKLAIMNLCLRGIDANLGQYNSDTFINDIHPNLRADFIMANPPFNLSNWGRDMLENDVRFKYGLPPDANANFAWLQHMIYHLSEKGKMGMVLANGSLSSQSGGEGEIRTKIIKDDLVDCIIAMPGQLFYTTAIPVCLWIISKNKKQKGKTLFIDAREMGEMETRKLRKLTKDEILKIAKVYEDYENGALEDVKGFCKVATSEDIEKQDYILTPGRYVGIAEQEEDTEPFDEKMGRLTKELGEMFAKSKELEEEIRKRLGGIGFEI